MKTEKDIIWVWDTEYDKKQAEQLEKRVKQKIIEEIKNMDDEDSEDIILFKQEILRSLGKKQ